MAARRWLRRNTRNTDHGTTTATHAPIQSGGDLRLEGALFGQPGSPAHTTAQEPGRYATATALPGRRRYAEPAGQDWVDSAGRRAMTRGCLHGGR